MRGLKTLFGTTALLAGLAMAPAAQAQISINIGVQPVCSYGYYGYAPYACAPMGYYGPGYFYNGIFLGMGPWGGWGYSHGWGGHRFVEKAEEATTADLGACPIASPTTRCAAARSKNRTVVAHSNGARPSAGHATETRGNATRPSRAKATLPIATVVVNMPTATNASNR